MLHLKKRIGEAGSTAVYRVIFSAGMNEISGLVFNRWLNEQKYEYAYV